MPAEPFSSLERNILRAKGLDEAQEAALAAAGILSRADLVTVGDPATLGELVPAIDPAVAARVLQWATGRSFEAPAPAPPASLIVESADIVACVHCGARQPKDYKSGDLCTGCGRQAEPILTCYWCASGGPGRFCRTCGARFVPPAELDLAILLRQEGLAKDDIPPRLAALSSAEKDVLWGRLRKRRG